MAGIIAAMHALHARDALLPSGWARDVLLEWDDAGIITRAEAGCEQGLIAGGYKLFRWGEEIEHRVKGH